MGEILIIAMIVLLLFGGKKIPEMMEGIGKGVKSFKKALNDDSEDIGDAKLRNTKEPNQDSKKEG